MYPRELSPRGGNRVPSACGRGTARAWPRRRECGILRRRIHDHRGIFIPPGVAHGFASLTDMTITYLVDSYYNPTDERGLAWNDPMVKADWGIQSPILSKRDQENPTRDKIDPQFQPHIGLRT